MEPYQLPQHLWQWGSGGMLAALYKETFTTAEDNLSCLLWFGLPLSTFSHTFQQNLLSSYRVLHFSWEVLTVGTMNICFTLFQNKDDSWGKRS